MSIKIARLIWKYIFRVIPYFMSYCTVDPVSVEMASSPHQPERPVRVTVKHHRDKHRHIGPRNSVTPQVSLIQCHFEGIRVWPSLGA